MNSPKPKDAEYVACDGHYLKKSGGSWLLWSRVHRKDEDNWEWRKADQSRCDDFYCLNLIKES